MDYFVLTAWLFFGLLILAIWQKVGPAKWRIGTGTGEHISPFAAIFAVLLTIAVIFLFTQIWNDLGSWVKDVIGKGQPRNVIELQELFVHTAFVIPVLILALLFFFGLYKRGTTARTVILPYFIGALAITIRLLFDVGSFVIREYEKIGIYVVLGVLIVVFSILVIVVQSWWQRGQEAEPDHRIE